MDTLSVLLLIMLRKRADRGQLLIVDINMLNFRGYAGRKHTTTDRVALRDRMSRVDMPY